MKYPEPKPSLPENHPYNVVSELLRGSDIVGASTARLTPAVERGVAALERRAPETIRLARKKAGVELEYLGISDLFAVPRFYEGVQTDWTLGPADRRADAIVPWRVMRELRHISGAGIDSALLYKADEIDQAYTADLRAEAAAGRREISHARAAALAGPVPPPAESVALGDRLAHRQTQMVNVGRQTLRVAGATVRGAVAVSATVVSGVLASAATLDPIILAAQPAISEKPGAPAAWFLIARWDW